MALTLPPPALLPLYIFLQKKCFTQFNLSHLIFWDRLKTGCWLLCICSPTVISVIDVHVHRSYKTIDIYTFDVTLSLCHSVANKQLFSSHLVCIDGPIGH